MTIYENDKTKISLLNTYDKDQSIMLKYQTHEAAKEMEDIDSKKRIEDEKKRKHDLSRF